MHITATDLNKRTGAYLDSAIKEPVVIEKTGRPFVVMISYDRYRELEAAEDRYWGELAVGVEKQAEWLNNKESVDFLTTIIKDKN